MKILPLQGNNIGFTAKAWRNIEASLFKKAQNVNPDQEEAYWLSLAELPVTSTSSNAGSEEMSGFVQSPSSWGGKEVNTGSENYFSVQIALNGSVVLPPRFSGTPDEEIKKEIEQDFSDSWTENQACRQIVNECKKELVGEKSDSDDVEVTVTSFSKQTDGSAIVAINLKVTSSSYESEFDAKTRADDQRGEME